MNVAHPLDVIAEFSKMFRKILKSYKTTDGKTEFFQALNDAAVVATELEFDEHVIHLSPLEDAIWTMVDLQKSLQNNMRLTDHTEDQFDRIFQALERAKTCLTDEHLREKRKLYSVKNYDKPLIV